MAGLISHPLGVGRCDTATVCGPAGVILSARTSEGAADNLRSVNQGAGGFRLRRWRCDRRGGGGAGRLPPARAAICASLPPCSPKRRIWWWRPNPISSRSPTCAASGCCWARANSGGLVRRARHSCRLSRAGPREIVSDETAGPADEGRQDRRLFRRRPACRWIRSRI